MNKARALDNLYNIIVVPVGRNGCQIENELHNRYDSKRMQGEFFKLTSHDIDDITTYLLEKYDKSVSTAKDNVTPLLEVL
ncbi:hypothetical protein [Phthorimaea operculella granulovirus]|uniref:Uncharacterized protein n=1 Tax=Phthorimaea operculella granulovirus TaxID=192584 RepID=Q8JS48_9BBAC|nr:hypothetical protein [Phthorimaea operculella granulovirus]AAM70209.1 unknown [Phthorimaea operculella granulovirus]ANY57400.1 hypothetical protein PhopGVgp011 [Phthorimaea operculella granulovirus]QBH65846.1 hypothetical protein PhopGVgp011 [Phthorimaea operculella granulovirus]QBH65976.1 hypothetical protein PhopGVgp011 [Phthorimaea operculella granulovirus]QBH66366.1 hypothetical protein PhopGVgp011 [Phthorimaea operculella granulovirus]